MNNSLIFDCWGEKNNQFGATNLVCERNVTLVADVIVHFVIVIIIIDNFVRVDTKTSKFKM